MGRFLIILGLFGLTISANAAPLNTELVINGGAETGDITGWNSTGIDAVIPDVFALGFGSFVFTGGTGPANAQTLSQSIDVTGNAAQIDANLLVSAFSIQLQSRSDSGYLDEARVDVFFRDGSGNTLDSFSFTDTINTDLFDWNLYADTRFIINGTRSIDILLTTSRTIGESSDGQFDEVSLMLLQPVPVPAAVWLFVSGIIGLSGFIKKGYR